jgi:hypothetical protein
MTHPTSKQDIERQRKEIRDFAATKIRKKPLRITHDLVAPDGSTIKVEIRQPNAGQMEELITRAEYDPASKSFRRPATFNALACVMCAYVPGTEMHLWDEGEFDELMSDTSDGLPPQIGRLVNETIGAAIEEGKRSAPTATSGSSTPSPANSENQSAG